MSEKDFRLNWHRSINFGDLLNPYIVNHFLGFYPPKYEIWNERRGKHEYLSDPHFMLLGSILSEANKNTTVIGAGFASDKNECLEKPKFISVRGKETLKRVRSLYEVGDDIFIGDPGIIMPKIFNPHAEKKFKLGIIPHIIDVDDVSISYKKMVNRSFNKKEAKIINLKCWNFPQDVERVISEMVQCEAIISSSLHGLVIAHSYGIPALWVEFSNKVIGGGFKFRDYFSAHLDDPESHPNYNPLDLKNGQIRDFSLEDLVERAKKSNIDLSQDIEKTYLFYKKILKK